MTFRNPIMLVGLAAALVPLVLHLLNRARYRSVAWGAMMFLDGLEPRAYHGAKVKQWALLAARTALLGTLAVALARPVLPAGAAPPVRQGRTAAVILLDTSASMSLNDNGRVRLDLAREAVLQLLSPGMKRGDDVWLLPLSERDPQLPPLYATDPQEMARRLKDVSSASGQADIAAGLRQAVQLLRKSEAPNHEIYVVCDRQAGSWRGVEAPTFAAEWRAIAPPTVRVMVIPVGTEDFDNVAVEAIDLVGEPFVIGQAGEVEVRLHNYGAVPRSAALLDVGVRTASGRRVTARQATISLPAGAVTRVPVPITFTEAGSAVVHAQVTAPGLPTDKRLDVSAEVIKDIRVLIVDGDEREGTAQSASDFLRAALAPYRNAKRDTATVTVTRPDVWTPADLADARVVVLANVGSFSEAQSRAIEQFIWDGGGVILAPGDQVRAENYNAQLRWLPALLQPPTAESEAGLTALGAVEIGHPAFRFLKGRGEAAPPVAVRRYFPAAPRLGSDVPASYTDGKPFMISRGLGRGRVVLMTTPVDTEWNGLPLTNVFLPLAQSLVRYAAGGPSGIAVARRNLLPGNPIVADFIEPLDPRTVTVSVPGGGKPDLLRLSMARGDFGGQVTYFGTYAPGVYRVSPRGPFDLRAQHFVIAEAPAAESDLTPLTDEQWDRIGRTIGCERIDPESGAVTVAQDAYRNGMELWLPLVGVAVVLSMIELSAARRWAGRET